MNAWSSQPTASRTAQIFLVVGLALVTRDTKSTNWIPPDVKIRTNAQEVRDCDVITRSKSKYKTCISTFKSALKSQEEQDTGLFYVSVNEPQHCTECVNYEGGFSCTGCDDGFVLFQNQSGCADVDECTFSNGGCQQVSGIDNSPIIGLSPFTYSNANYRNLLRLRKCEKMSSFVQCEVGWESSKIRWVCWK